MPELDLALHVPDFYKFVTARAKLLAWQNAPDLSAAEREQRRDVFETLVERVTSAWDGDLECESLCFEGDLDIRRCTALTVLPSGLKVSGKLYCGGCTSLIRLPDGLHVGGDLDCSDCTSLTRLADRLRVDGNLNCANCVSLTHLPEGLHVGGDLDCPGCSRLAQLPATLSVGGSINCSICINLTRLPNGLHVAGTLECAGCTSLSHLPDGLSVGGSLSCFYCTQLRQLPDGLRVDGNLNCTGCLNLTSLPQDLTAWGPSIYGRTRIINLTGTGLSADILQRLQQAEAPGMQFYFSLASHAASDARFGDLRAATNFWYDQLYPNSAPHLTALHALPGHDRDLLTQFLGRLCDTADYQHPGTRGRLARRVCDLLQAMDQSPELRGQCSDCISDALQTCGDRVIWAMNQAETAVRLHQATSGQDAEALRGLILGFMRLDIVQAHARHKATTLTWVDEIEVFLAYESALREKLTLPVSAENMLFASCAQVSQSDLDAAQQAAESAMQDPSRIAAYLRASAPWQRHLRQKAASTWSWSALTPQPWPKSLPTQGLLCPITQESLSDLVEPLLCPTGGTWVAYEAAALMKYWIEHGTDVHRQKFYLSALKRPALPPIGHDTTVSMEAAPAARSPQPTG